MKTSSNAFHRRDILVFSCFLGGLCFVYGIRFWSLNIPTNFDGFLYGTFAKSMLDFSSFWTPLGIHQEPYFFKPPATLWQGMLGIKIFGESLFGLRFFLIPIQVLTILLFFLNARRLQIQPKFVWLTTIMYAFSNASFKLTRNLIMENLLAAWVMLVIYLCLRYRDSSNIKWLVMNGILAGLACLIKGIIALPIFALIIGAFLWSHKASLNLSLRKTMNAFVLVMCLAVIFSLIWPVMMTLQHGWTFIEVHFLQEHFGKFNNTPNPYGRLFIGLLVYSLPFTHWVMICLFHHIRHFKKPSIDFRFLGIALGCCILLFLLPSRRAMNYMLPFIGILYLLCGVILQQHQQTLKHLGRSIVPILICLCLNVLYVVIFLQLQPEESMGLPWVLMALCIQLLILFSLMHVSIKKQHAMWLSACALSVQSLLIWTVQMQQVIKPEVQFQPSVFSKPTPICYVKAIPRGYEIMLQIPRYLPHTVELVWEAQELDHCIQQGAAFVVQSNHLPKLQSKFDQHYQVVDRWSYYKRGLDIKTVLTAILNKSPNIIRDEVRVFALKEQTHSNTVDRRDKKRLD